MAIYHCSVKIVARNDGRSAVAAAAYRSGECLVNEYDGVVHDYTRKNWVQHAEIMLPENAPKEYTNRETLWNAVELSERSKDAQLAREFELALPIEMTPEQQIALVKRFANEILVSDGMIADICIHNPPVTNDRHQPIDENGNPTRDEKEMQFRNPHAHILVTMRPLDSEGSWEKKSQAEYICKCGEEERGFTAEEYKEAVKDGWEKQYKYHDNGKKVYHTPSEAKERNLERADRNPKTSRFGRRNEKVERWNSKEQLAAWRKAWEEVVNSEFERLHLDVRIDSRSFKEQGRTDEIPTLHLGNRAWNLEKRALRELNEGRDESEIVHSDIGIINMEIKEHNRIVRELRELFKQPIEQAKDLNKELAHRLEGMRATMIGEIYEANVISSQLGFMQKEAAALSGALNRYDTEREKVKSADAESAMRIQEMQEELRNCLPHQFQKRREIQRKIQKEQESIEQRKEYLDGVFRQCGFHSVVDYKVAEKEFQRKNRECGKMESALERIEKDTMRLTSQFESAYGRIDAAVFPELNKIRSGLRGTFEVAVLDKLKYEYENMFSEETYIDAVRRTNAILDRIEAAGAVQVAARNRSKQHRR